MPRLAHYGNDMMMPNHDVHMRVDLHFVGGGSNKVYILQVEKSRTQNTWSVHCYYGRNGAMGLAKQAYGTHVTYQAAKNEMRIKQREKEGKGYKFIHEEEVTGMGTMTKNASQTINTLSPLPSAQNQPPLPLPLKEAKASIPLVTMSKLQSLKAMPNMATVDSSAFLKTIKNDDMVMFKLPTLRFHYAILQDADWILYDAYDIAKRPTPEFFPVDPARGDAQGRANMQGLGWMGILDMNGDFLITDLVCIPGVTEVYKKPWRARRQMMNVIYETLYPGVDPYDASNSLRFADYIYDTKTHDFNFGAGVFAAFNVTHPINGRFYVSNK